MTVYFANRRMDILGMASIDLPDSYVLQHDVKKTDLDSGVSSFEMELLYPEDKHVQTKEIAAVGNYLLRYHADEMEFYTIIDSEDDDEKNTIYIYAEDAGLDLLNEIVQPYTATEAKSAAWYVERFTKDSGFEVGLNEVSDLTRTLSWDGTATASERVRSVATQFGAEIGYRFTIDKLTVTHKYIDIYEHRGVDTQQELRLGREVAKIVEKKSIANLVTCLRVTGGTPEGGTAPINLIGYTYDDGDIYVDQTYGDLKSRKALETWSRYLAETGTGDGHIVGTFSYDTTDKETLCAKAIEDLKKRREPAINYEVTLFYLPSNLRIGDYVRIVDDNGELYLSSRILAIEERVSDNQYYCTFGEFVIKDSGISEKLIEMAAQIAKTSTKYTWIAYADDANGTNISTDPTGKAYIGVAANMTDPTVVLTNPSIFSWSLIKGATFTPNVSADGVISWTNDGGLPNPTQRDITGPEAYVNIEMSSVSFSGDSATLKAVLYVDGVAKTTGVTYKWTKDSSTTSLGTNQTLSITSLDHVYHCECTWTGGSQIGSTDLRSLRSAGRTAESASTAATNAAKVATNYLSFDNSTGLDVGYSETNAKTRINGSGVQVFNASNVSVAEFGSTTRIGENGSRSLVVLDGVGANTKIKVPVCYGLVNPQIVGSTILDAYGLTATGDKGSIRLFPTYDPDQPNPLYDDALIYAADSSSNTLIHVAPAGVTIGKGLDVTGEITTHVGAHGAYIQVRGSSSSESLSGGGVVPININTTTLAYNPTINGSTVFTRDDTNHCVTVNVTAVYRVSAAMSITPSAATGNVGVYVRKIYNSTTTDVLSSYVYAGSTYVKEINCGPKLLRIEAGAKIYLCGRDTSGNGTANTANVNTYLLLERITAS